MTRAPSPNSLNARKAARTASPAVRALIDIVDASGLSYRAIEARAGVYQHCLTSAKTGKVSPSIDKVEAVGEALGFRLAWVSISSNPSHDNSRQE